jgi:hypothetical protein
MAYRLPMASSSANNPSNRKELFKENVRYSHLGNAQYAVVAGLNAELAYGIFP